MLNPYVKTFLKVADYGSFSSAADQLYISKVSVMNQINALEARVGVPLFDRTHHGVSLTDAGKSFYTNAEAMVRLSEDSIHEARQIGGVTSRTIRVGTSIMRPYNGLIELWENAGVDNSEYQFSVVPFNDDSDSLNAMLAAIGDQIDCFVTPCGSMSMLMNYSFLPLSSRKCAIAMSKNTGWQKKRSSVGRIWRENLCYWLNAGSLMYWMRCGMRFTASIHLFKSLILTATMICPRSIYVNREDI